MSQVIQITVAFASIVLFLFPIGFIIKYFWPKLPWPLIPVFGLIVYGGVAVPAQYFIGRFSLVILDVIVALLTALGLIFLVLHIRSKTHRTFGWRDGALAVLLSVGAAVMILSIAQQPVPGGIDPAIHSVTMTMIETSGQLNVKYPLGLHTFLLFFEGLLHSSRAYIMQAFAVFLSLNFFTLTYVLLRRISGKSIVGWLGVIAAVFDASFYNNLLNGSLTHILAINVILCYLLYLETLKMRATQRSILLLILLSLSIVYFHFISWYFVVPALWIQRLMLKRHRLHYLITMVAVLLLSIPLIVRLYDYENYSEIFIKSTALIIGVEVLLFVGGNYVHRFINKQWLYPILGGIILSLFFYHRNIIFYNVDQWYGWSLLGLAGVGVGYCSLKRQPHWLPYLLLFGTYTVLFASFDWGIDEINKIVIIKELLFYYGFTVPFVLLAAIGLYCFVILGSSRRVQTLKVAMVSIIAVLIFASRMSDTVLVAGGNAISRYNSNSGFGMFYQKNDVSLAHWFREYIDDSSVIANAGGLYGVWTSMAGHPMVYLARNQIDVAQPTEVNQEIINLMTDGSSGQPAVLLSNNIRYLFVPQTVPADIVHPYLQLLHQIGTSRVYRILDQPATTDRVITLIPLLDNTIEDVHLTGDYGVQKALNGRAFFYQFQSVAQVLTLNSEKLIRLKFDAVSVQREVLLKLNTTSEALGVFVNGVPVSRQPSQTGERAYTIPLPASHDTILTVQNTGIDSASITNIIGQFNE